MSSLLFYYQIIVRKCMWTCQSHILSKMSWASTFTSSCVGGHVNLISLVVGEHAKSHLFIMWVCASLLFYIRKIDKKYGPKTSQNRSFEGVLMALGGSWGALGAILAHVGPKSQHKFKKSGSLAPLAPFSWGHLGAQVGLMLEHVGEKRVSRQSWKTCCFETSFFQRNLVSQGLSWTPKIKENHRRVAKNEVFGFPLKVALGMGLGASFGRVFGPKLGPSWVHVGT